MKLISRPVGLEEYMGIGNETAVSIAWVVWCVLVEKNHV